MASSIDQHFVKQYSANVFHLSQQKGSRLAQVVRNEVQNSESAFYDRIGQTEAVDKTTRHGDTPLIEVDHSRRRVTLVDKEWATLLDNEDKIRMLNDPTSEYAQAAMWALGRKKDTEIISKGLGTAYSGKEGATAVTLPNAQKLASVSGGSGSGLNIQALRRVKKKFMAAEVDPSEGKYGVINAEGFEDLLGENEITSADYNTIRALVNGEVNTFMGFEFIHSERLTAQSGSLSFDTSSGAVGSGAGDADGYRQGLFFCKMGILYAQASEINGKISERDDKSYSTQVFASLSMGATRMEEEKVVELLYAE